MKKFNFDYEELAKMILTQMPGNVEATSLQVFLDEYVSYVERNRAPKTAEGVRLVCKKLLTYFSPSKKIDSIQLKDAEQFLESQKKSAPKAIHNYHRVLKSMWNKAIEWNYLRENAFTKVKLPKLQKPKPDYLSKKDVQLIIENTETELIKDVILTAFTTGMRLGEIVQLRYSDIDLENRIITVGNQSFTTKSKKIRFIPLNEVMVQLLSRRMGPGKHKGKFVFGKSSGMAYTTDYFSKKYKAALRKSGIINDYHFHSLRHGFASRLAQKGVPLINISKLLGHSNISTTMIYSQVNLDDLRRGIETL